MHGALIILGTVWPIAAFPLVVLSASLAPDGWKHGVLLLSGPAIVCLLHENYVLPHVLRGGNLFAAVVYGLLIAAMVLYYPGAIIYIVIRFMRRHTAQHEKDTD